MVRTLIASIQGADFCFVYIANIDNHLRYIYLLAEHQTTVDKWMPLRLVRYVLRLLERHREQYPKNDLPVVYPCIFYTGGRH